MNALRVSLLVLPIAVWATFGDQPPTGAKTTVKLNGHSFTLPAGFTIELAAGPPLVDRPIAIDFDEEGRLYVTESSGTNENIQNQLKKKPHRILRLESTKGDGKFDKRTVFADKMMFPEGIMYYKGSIYVAAPPSIWKLTDTDGDGVADQRVEWFEGKTLTNCANDLHGPYLGPDGWIYWCKGAFANQTYELPGKGTFKTRAAHIFRAKPDGTNIEPVMTGGMDNPVDVVFTPGGERIFTTTFLQYPGGGKRDGLIHAVYGGVYGKEHHDVIDSHIWTGPNVMPVMTHLGAAAPAGLHRYESDIFGNEYKDNLFSCLFNMRKVMRHVLVPDGSTFKTLDSDFLVSDNPDFHPTDVIEDADGSLLVVDTGGWYKLCCPTTQLIKPESLGGVYRIRKIGAAKVDDPRGLRLKWGDMTLDEMTDLAVDPRPLVRKRVLDRLGDKLLSVVLTEPLPQKPIVAVSSHPEIIWALTRISSPLARGLARSQISAPDETMRLAAIHSAGLWRDQKALDALLNTLKGQSMPHRRAAAEAIGRIGDRSAVPALLAALEMPCDRVLEHSLIYALIELNDVKGTAVGLQSKSAAVRRGALIALDNMPEKDLNAGIARLNMVKEELASTDPRMKEAAWWLAGRHPEWSRPMSDFLRERLKIKNLTAAEQDELGGFLAKFVRGLGVQNLLAEHLSDESSSRDSRRTVLKAMAQSGLKQAPDRWIDSLTKVLAREDFEIVEDAIRTARTWRDGKQKGDKLAGALYKTAANSNAPAAVRLGALAAVPGGLAKVDTVQLELLLTHLGADQPIAHRTAAAEVLGRAKLTNPQLRSVIAILNTVGPMELDRVLSPFANSSDDTIGKELLAALKSSPAKTSLRPDMLKPRLAKFGPAVQKEALELYASLQVDAVKEQAQLTHLLQTLPAGDKGRGQLVYNSEKAACFSCHAIGYLGGNIGPDLTHIAKTRTDRDLLEAVVYPNASFVRGYEPVQVTTNDGKQFNGVLRKDAPDEIMLATAANQEVRIARAEIDDMRPSQISVMPAGNEQLLTPRELADLLAFLKACK